MGMGNVSVWMIDRATGLEAEAMVRRQLRRVAG